jgi:hypothetical protein
MRPISSNSLLQNTVTVENGLHPIIAALEKLLYPSYPAVISIEALAQRCGGSFSIPAPTQQKRPEKGMVHGIRPDDLV